MKHINTLRKMMALRRIFTANNGSDISYDKKGH